MLEAAELMPDPLRDLSSQFWEKIRQAKTIVITSHIDPDGDAIGSSLGLYHTLCRLDKDPIVACRDPAPSHLGFIPGSDLIHTGGKVPIDDAARIDLLVILDCSDAIRLGENRSLIDRANDVVVVDHHADHNILTGLSIVDETASATAEILYRLIRQGNVPLIAEAALALYVAIMTDTGSFRYGNTSAHSFRIASDLIKTAAIDVRSIGIHIFARETLSRLRLRGLVYRRARIENGMVYSVLTREMLIESGSNSTEAEPIVDDLALCYEAEIAVVYWEITQGVIRIQLRSIHDVSVLEIAQALGGGGHRKAAGCRVRGVSLAEAHEMTCDAARLALQEAHPVSQ